MATVNEQIVRDYLETLGFLVRQPRKYQVVARAKGLNEEVDFLAVRPPSEASAAEWPDPGIWGAAELERVGAVLVAVRGWHTERFTAAMLASSPEVYRFAEADSARTAEAELGGVRAARILCLGSLPADSESRAEALAFLRSRGVDGVVLFRPMLRELAERIDEKKNYEKSDILQLLRILKSYGMLHSGQLDLFGSRRRRTAGGGRTEPPTEATSELPLLAAEETSASAETSEENGELS